MRLKSARRAPVSGPRPTSVTCSSTSTCAARSRDSPRQDPTPLCLGRLARDGGLGLILTHSGVLCRRETVARSWWFSLEHALPAPSSSWPRASSPPPRPRPTTGRSSAARIATASRRNRAAADLAAGRPEGAVDDAALRGVRSGGDRRREGLLQRLRRGGGRLSRPLPDPGRRQGTLAGQGSGEDPPQSRHHPYRPGHRRQARLRDRPQVRLPLHRRRDRPGGLAEGPRRRSTAPSPDLVQRPVPADREGPRGDRAGRHEGPDGGPRQGDRQADLDDAEPRTVRISHASPMPAELCGVAQYLYCTLDGTFGVARPTASCSGTSRASSTFPSPPRRWSSTATGST